MIESDVLDQILNPVAPETPAGEWLRFDPAYDQIKEARREDEEISSGGVWERSDSKRADWSLVQDLCLKELQTRSKDVQLAIWLTEAWVQLQGFAGLRDGLQVVLALSEAFWEELYPPLDEDDNERRQAPYRWLTSPEKLPLKLSLIRFTRPDGDAPEVCWNDHTAARQLELSARTDPDVLTQALNEGRVTTELFNRSVDLTAPDVFTQLHEEIAGCLDGVAALATFLDDRLGNDAPSFQSLRTVLEEIGRFAAQHGVTESQVEEEGGATIDDESTGVAPGAGGGGGVKAITTREEAYRALASTADFLGRVEPHSPAPYLIRRAIAWGSMPLTQVLRELMESGGDLESIYRLLGVREPDEE